jgi:hypothetical protein
MVAGPMVQRMNREPTMEDHEITPEYLHQRERATRAARYRFDCFEGEAVVRCEKVGDDYVARAFGPGCPGVYDGEPRSTPEAAAASLTEALAVPAYVLDGVARPGAEGGAS